MRPADVVKCTVIDLFPLTASTRQPWNKPDNSPAVIRARMTEITFDIVGSASPITTKMMAHTTSNSINVKPLFFLCDLRFMPIQPAQCSGD